MSPAPLPDSVRLLQANLRADLLLAIGPALGPSVSWSSARVPTLTDPDLLRGLVLRAGANPEHLLRDLSPTTAIEQGQGNWESALVNLAPARGAGPAPLDALAALFDTHVRPSALAPRTRVKAWLGWRAVLSWAAAHWCLHRIMPMDKQTFHALLWELLQLQCSFLVIKGIINGIQSRHRFFGLASPIGPNGEYSSLTVMLSRFQGRQRKWTFPINRDLVVALLRVRTPSLGVWRNCLAGATTSICCMRPSEGAQAQACDVWFDFDALAGYLQYLGTLAMNIPNRKNDQARRGHHPRVGCSEDPALDLVCQLRNYMTRAKLLPRPGCTKRSRPHARCPVCPPLFPLSLNGRAGANTMSDRAPTPTSFSRMVTRGLDAIGVDTGSFSGACARKGGISTAIEAGVPEVILWMQSGHSQNRAARSYITLNSPALLFHTWAAFKL